MPWIASSGGTIDVSPRIVLNKSAIALSTFPENIGNQTVEAPLYSDSSPGMKSSPFGQWIKVPDGNIELYRSGMLDGGEITWKYSYREMIVLNKNEVKCQMPLFQPPGIHLGLTQCYVQATQRTARGLFVEGSITRDQYDALIADKRTIQLPSTVSTQRAIVEVADDIGISMKSLAVVAVAGALVYFGSKFL